MSAKTLQERAKTARLRAGFRLPQDAADAIGCSRPLVLAWENGSAKSIGSRFLLDAARIYKVRPEWLALDSDDDGYPWPESVTKPQPTDTQPESQFGRPNPTTMLAAVDLLAFDEDHAGPYTVLGRTRRLLELYDRITADGGEKLSADSNRLFEDEVRARERLKTGAHKDVGQQQPSKPTRMGRT